ncbi:TcpQ domain-containing protein [Thalassotalea euphylliae]|uniref:TcpQ domain-containing protein n=1 Tax=Thalassotalea euphylliae TaxID=1655234 RepID=UPI00363C9933
MNFWVRNIIFAAVLSGLAYFLLANHELLLALAEGSGEQEASQPVQTGEAATADTKKEVIEPPQRSKKKLSSNKAAEGLSKFYANLHGYGEEDDGPKIRDGVVYLPDVKGDMEKLLEGKAMVTRPLKPNWRGTKESRAFRTGQTLFQKLSEYAEQDGLEVMWRLNRDLLIKDPFRINKGILDTAYQIGVAISGYFPEGVKVYFCYKQRTIVFDDGNSEYLSDQCRLLTSKQQQQQSRYY